MVRNAPFLAALLPSSPAEWEVLLLNIVNVLLGLVLVAVVAYVGGGALIEALGRRTKRASRPRIPG
ncbi:MAG: hypothetical protein HY822_07755 [Acidobacteria bacterium]|nr:hypothetical protein [Acidobacteriota bacterium]